ncbi:MAG TPA: methyltransferase domain-containing protein [Gemmatimonadaceae bacterium]|nr:methyltransferase domain-containing protein [Gemmatimonadaceae bacterium]
MPASLTPPRRRGVEILDLPDVDPHVVTRSLADVARANALFGGISSAMEEIKEALRELPPHATLLDVGTGLGDIPCRARSFAAEKGVELTTVGLDSALELARASRHAVSAAVCGDALHLPFADRSIDIVMCSQVLHHFIDSDAATLLREMDRVARVRVVVSDLRRSWLAAAGLWLASFPLGFHAVSRHDGVVSVLRGFTREERSATVNDAIARVPVVHQRRGFRITASWTPGAR